MSPVTEYAIGLDFGQTTIKGGVVDSLGKIILESEITSFNPSKPENILTRLGDYLKDINNQAQGAGIKISAAGISSTIDVDSSTGKIRFMNKDEFKYLSSISFSTELTKILKLPVIIENDGIAAAWGEFNAGAGVGFKNILSVTLGTGIGGGIIIDGKRFTDSIGSAAYFGHMCIDIHGPKCPVCPNSGCWELYASGQALEKNAADLIARNKPNTILSPNPSGKEIILASQSGDLIANELLNNLGYYLGIGLVNLLNIFNPEIIILGGGLANAGDLILIPALETINKKRMPLREDFEIKLSELGKFSGVVGVGLLALNSIN